MNADPPDRAQLERRANAVRSHLLRTIDRLDGKRRDLMSPVLETRKHLVPLGVFGGALLVSLASGWAVTAWSEAHRRRRLGEERMRALRRLWSHPDWLARREPPKRSLLAEAGRSALISLLSYAVVQIAKSAAQGSSKRALKS